jgi:hypothetical protein
VWSVLLSYTDSDCPLQVHEEMELKDQELRDIRQQCVNLQEESKICTEKVDKLEKSSQFIINIDLNA